MRFSFLKTLFFCLVKEFLFLLWSHLGCYASNVGHKFLWVHSFWWGVGWSVRWGDVAEGVQVEAFCFSGQNLLICPALLQLKQSPFSSCLLVCPCSTHPHPLHPGLIVGYSIFASVPLFLFLGFFLLITPEFVASF